MNLKLLTAVILIVLLAIAGIVYYSTKKQEKVDVTDIRKKFDQYINPEYLSTLTFDEKIKVANDLTYIFNENCKSGKIEGNCTKYFLITYMRTMGSINSMVVDYFNGSAPARSPFNLPKRSLLEGVYSDLMKHYEKLTEYDLGGFEVPLFVSGCQIGIIDSSERLSLLDNILKVNKTSYTSTDMQIYYIQGCMNVNNISALSSITGKSEEILNATICNLLPSKNEINQNDLCLVADHLNMKRFCGFDLGEYKDVVDDLLKKQYESYYQNSCKDGLVQFYKNFIYSE